MTRSLTYFCSVIWLSFTPVLQAGDAVRASGSSRHSVALTNRPMAEGPARYVDPLKGSDTDSGTQAAPWKTIQASLEKLQPGDTLYLRGGIYFERVYCAISGTPEAPITIRSFPGEHAIIDGGIPEFETHPAESWEPVPNGAEGEFQSRNLFKNIRDVVGLFGDTNIGLQTYWHPEDLRADNEIWIGSPDKKIPVSPIYCGPGLWLDRSTGRIHVRLNHTHIANAQVVNYEGETDPRKLPLVIAPFNANSLLIDQGMRLRFQDLVFRGGGLNNIWMRFAADIEFDHVTVFGGTYCLRSKNSGPVKFLNSALYGGIAPWAFYDENELRTFSPLYSDPYTHGPGTENLRNIARLTAHALLVMEGGEESDVFCYPYNNRWEIAYSEFADGHDGVYCNGTSLRMHDNWIGNMEDDAIYLSSPTPGVCDDIHIYKNFITGCTTAFGCCGRGTTKGSIFVYGNVVDFRNGIHFKRATPENPTGIIQSTNFLLVHGTRNMRTIESLYFYHNTAVLSGKLRSYLGNTLANTMPGSTRHVANNLFFYLGGYPQIRTEKQPGEDVWIDGNVHWSQAAEQPADWLKPVRDSAGSELSKKYYPGGWEAHSKLAAPEFVSFSESPDAINDYRLQPGTALETAQPLPKTPVLEGGVGGAQAGAFQQGEAAARVGVDKRILVGFPAK